MIRNVIVKVTLGCNIDCRYCYVQRNRDVVRDQIMSPATLEALVRNVGKYLHRSPLNAEEFVFYWHGGGTLTCRDTVFRTGHAVAAAVPAEQHVRHQYHPD